MKWKVIIGEMEKQHKILAMKRKPWKIIGDEFSDGQQSLSGALDIWSISDLGLFLNFKPNLNLGFCILDSS